MAELVKQKEIADICVSASQDKLAENIMIMQVSEVSSIADYFVLVTANSVPHIRAVVNGIEKVLFDKLKVKCKQEGSPESEWVLLDCGGAVLVHIMTPEFRAKFQLESLWGDTIGKNGEKKSRRKKEV
ncbi:MAG: ribosome silencing factor [Victivallaceae bacterium]|jgi:ribosome-associated protein|nr:ribosome silencing factor [Victivallaceae bacterium]NLK84158.1 ribosome silencing factor [Lentisphaerota bacterium]MDD3117174.1 ribosome silencing factor [Victivallaceae bacterium]MDD3703724.1 ribosome silencing factor [Victivallaceae bacterium]MDD4317809.1 ribosome silencing factor [Victivallaceae bacterium]